MLHSFKTNKPGIRFKSPLPIAFNFSQKLVLTPQEQMEYEGNPTLDSAGWKPNYFKTYFALPMQVNYAVESFEIPHYTHNDTPTLHVLCKILYHILK